MVGIMGGGEKEKGNIKREVMKIKKVEGGWGLEAR